MPPETDEDWEEHYEGKWIPGESDKPEDLENELLETLVALVEASEEISPDETNITDMTHERERKVALLRYKGKAFALTVERF